MGLLKQQGGSAALGFGFECTQGSGKGLEAAFVHLGDEAGTGRNGGRLRGRDDAGEIHGTGGVELR